MQLLSRLREVLRRRLKRGGKGVDDEAKLKIGERTTEKQRLDAIQSGIKACNLSQFDELKIKGKIREMKEELGGKDFLDWLVSGEALKEMKAKQHSSIKKQSIATAPTRSLRPPRAFDIWKPRPLPQIMEIDEKSPAFAPESERFRTTAQAGMVDAKKQMDRRSQQVEARLNRIRKHAREMQDHCKDLDQRRRSRGQAYLERMRRAQAGYLQKIERIQKLEQRQLKSIKATGAANPVLSNPRGVTQIHFG